MQKRICPHCFTRWYSADSSRAWKCQNCDHDIPVPKDGEEIADCNSRTVQDLQATDTVDEKTH